MDYLVKAYAMHDGVRIYAAKTTELVSYPQKRFNMWPTSAAALGRTLTISAIMSCTYKSGEFLNIIVDGDGPIGKITVEATDGKVRGYVQNPGVYLKKGEKLNVGLGVGNGTIEVIKDLHMRQPFSSSCELVSGEIAEDFTYYFAKSEQIPSSVGLGVLFNPDSSVKAAGGFLIQVMPGCKSEDLDKLEAKLKTLKPTSQMIDEGMSPEEIINEITDGDYTFLEKRELSYECNCSKQRFEKALETLEIKDLEDILNKDKKAEIVCNFCNEKYIFDENDLTKIILKKKTKK